MNIPRLQELAKMLRTVPSSEFDIGSWQSDCGSTACAVGWACHYPPFMIKGLHISKDGVPTFKKLDSWRAVERFFDLDKYEAEELFYEDNYDDDPTPNDVADRIMEFIKS